MIIDGESLTVDKVVRVARLREKVEISPQALHRVKSSRKVVEKILKEGKVVYGINTGLGELVRVRISPEDLRELQVNLIRSHASGVGEFMPEDVVRASILIRANSLLKGYSGVRAEIIQGLINLLNKDVIPLVPKFGSVGASGDLAPLAHIALVLMGEGYAKYKGNILNGGEALEMAGLEPIEIREREGLALLNGTAVMAAYASLNIYDAYNTFKHALVSAAMSFEALRATDRALDERIMVARNQLGQLRVAKVLRTLLEGSEIIKKARNEKVQDAYTLRCIPQVYGAILDTLDYVKSIVEREINAVTDNPLIFDEPISGGNFHGEPLALVMDFLAIALTDLGNIIERRIARMIDEKLSGLPAFLIENSGKNSGLMIPQYTAAALCNRNKILAYPASVDSIPTSANQEDHVSMGMNAAQKAMEIVNNLRYIVAIEYLVANQALYFVGKPSPLVSQVRKNLNIDKFERDAVFSYYIEGIRRKMDAGEILRGINISL